VFFNTFIGGIVRDQVWIRKINNRYELTFCLLIYTTKKSIIYLFLQYGKLVNQNGLTVEWLCNSS
jgi:hypothetical protein